MAIAIDLLIVCHAVWNWLRQILIWQRTWWLHQMVAFSALLAICAENSPVNGEFPAQRPVTRSFDVFFDLRLNKRLSKQSWGWWFETQSRPLWRHRNASCGSDLKKSVESKFQSLFLSSRDKTSLKLNVVVDGSNRWQKIEIQWPCISNMYLQYIRRLNALKSNDILFQTPHFWWFCILLFLVLWRWGLDIQLRRSMFCVE